MALDVLDSKKIRVGVAVTNMFCELSPITISKMGRGEFVSMDVLYRIGTKLGVDFGDMISIIKQKK